MENPDLNHWVVQSVRDNNELEINKIIEMYTPFIINSIAKHKKGYVSIENNDEFSIGLSAFHEAMKRYDEERGHFLVYANIVIKSRLNTYWSKENKYNSRSLSEHEDDILDLRSDIENVELREEVQHFEEELMKFGLDFETLVENSPKHRDTRERATSIGVRTSRESDFVEHLFNKRRLPITKMAARFFVSVKIIKKSRFYIMAVVIAIVKKYECITSWINIDE